MIQQLVSLVNEHIDHSSVSIAAGTGLNGGGTIASTRTLNVDSDYKNDSLKWHLR